MKYVQYRTESGKETNWINMDWNNVVWEEITSRIIWPVSSNKIILEWSVMNGHRVTANAIRQNKPFQTQIPS